MNSSSIFALGVLSNACKDSKTTQSISKQNAEIEFVKALDCSFYFTIAPKRFLIVNGFGILNHIQSFSVLLAQRLPARKPEEELPERRLLKNKQCEKVILQQDSNLQPLGYRSTGPPLVNR